MARRLLQVAAALILAAPLSSQQDSVRVTTFVQCPQTTVLDSLRAYDRAARERDSVLAAVFAEFPACPAPAPIEVPAYRPGFWDRAPIWGALVFSAAALIVTLSTRERVKVVERIIERPIDDDHEEDRP